MTLNELLEQFPDEDSCKAYLVANRWPDSVIRCPRCQSAKVFAVPHRPYHWVCKSGIKSTSPKGKEVVCHKRNGYRFSVISATIFQDTKWPLRDWFRVAFLMYQSKKGMSALQMQRLLGCKKYKTAWFMCHRIRAAMHDPNLPKLLGIVEVDETYLGGKAHWRHKSAAKQRRGGWDKTPVIGAISRKGNVVCQMIEHADISTMTKFVRKVVDKDKVDLVATDEHSGYFYLDKDGFKHDTVDHRRGEYVRGVVHTNNIENFWSLLKRGIVGTYHNVSKRYLPLYLAEFQFRFNNRKNPDIFRDIIARC
jgi:transposase-like protein